MNRVENGTQIRQQTNKFELILLVTNIEHFNHQSPLRYALASREHREIFNFTF